MSGYFVGNSVYLLDSTGSPVGMLGLDGREWAFPAAVVNNANAGELQRELPVLFDSVTFAPLGFVARNGVEYFFPTPLTLNTVRGYSTGSRIETTSSADVPLGVNAAAKVWTWPAALTTSVGGLVAALDLTLTSALPSQITFARAGTRNAIQGGAIVSIATGQPAFESWNSVNRGMAIEAAVTNSQLYSSDYTQAKWAQIGVTNSAGGTAPDGVGVMSLLSETAAVNNHQLQDFQTNTMNAGDRVTFSAFVRRPAGSTRQAVFMSMMQQFTGTGPYAIIRVDGVPGFYVYPNDQTAVMTNVIAGVDTLANGVLRVWMTGTWVATNNKEFMVGPALQTSLFAVNNGSGTASGSTTNAAGYAIGATVITLAAVGFGTILAGDEIFFAGDVNRYTVSVGNANVNAGGTITLAGTGLIAALSAATKAITYKTNSGISQYLGEVDRGVQIWGVQVTKTPRPAGYCPTAAATSSQAVESAIFNTLTWFSATTGTFVVDHDCYEGTLVGSGANVILAASFPGKTAVAYDGTNSQVVVNGGAATAGPVLTFGADIRLLSTNVASNTGHIKSIKFYASKLTTAQMQTLTGKPSTAVPGSWRVATVRARTPAAFYQLTTTKLNFAFRYRVTLGNFPLSKLKLVFQNWAFPSPNNAFPGTQNNNAVIFDSVKLERVTGVAESVAVTVGAAAAFTMAAAEPKLLSDDILASSFTGLTNFPANTEMWVRVKGHVASANQYIPGNRRNTSATEQASQSYVYDGTTTVTDTGTGPYTYTGVNPTGSLSEGYCPVLIGIPVTGDPLTIMIVGDSIIVNGNSMSYIAYACEQLGVPLLEVSQGGSDSDNLMYDTTWQQYLPYARVLIDEMGTNRNYVTLAQFDYFNTARNTYGYDQIIKVGLFPQTTSGDSFTTLAGQINRQGLAYPTPRELVSTNLKQFGWVDSVQVPQASRGSAAGIVTGATTNAAGYALAATAITLAAAGTGSILANTGISFGSDPTVYKVTVGLADVSVGGAITLAGPGLVFAIPAAATAVTENQLTNWLVRGTVGTGAGATTSGTALAIGTTVIPLAAAGTGTILAQDGIAFAGDLNTYVVTTGNGNVATGGSITLLAPGLRQAIPAAATAITVKAAAFLTTTDGIHMTDYVTQLLVAETVSWVGALTVS